ncbi:hypothetical protein VLK31_14845 [Variovorax sp. H27-G14]|uniref:hypothetical protein n=1 Tax=Variovorax sp. H27-G14 TaxID=3111914 RepID=UPI0038FC0233
MLRFLLVLPLLAALGACAPFHRPLAAADRGKVQEVDVRVVVAQESFMFSAQPPGVSAALGGGLVGALIDSSVQQSRQKAMSAEVQAIVGPLLDCDYRVEAGQALSAALAEPAAFPLKVRSTRVLAAMPTKAEQEARIAATQGGPAYLVLLVQYALEPGLGAFTTRTSALLWQDGRAEPSYRAAAIFQTPIGGSARAAVLRRLTANDGQVLRGVMRESMTQTLHAVALDMAGARSTGVKTARFNVNGSWVTLAGQSFDAQPGRVLFRDEDGALYSVRSAAP